MTPGRFARLLGRHGPSLDRWPPAERHTARTLLRLSPRARRAYLAALDAAAPEENQLPPDQIARLAERVQRRIAREPAPLARRRPAVPVRTAARWGALAACALLGAWIGRPDPVATPRPTLLAAVQVTALDASPRDFLP